MTIERLWTRNAAGADQTGFICGDQVRLSLSLANPNQRAVTATISFLAHNSERSLYNYDETLGIPAGPANYESPFNLPDDTDGEFDYVVMVQPAPGLSRVESSTTFTVTCGR